MKSITTTSWGSHSCALTSLSSCLLSSCPEPQESSGWGRTDAWGSSLKERSFTPESAVPGPGCRLPAATPTPPHPTPFTVCCSVRPVFEAQWKFCLPVPLFLIPPSRLGCSCPLLLYPGLWCLRVFWKRNWLSVGKGLKCQECSQCAQES